jgi:opacity protein-like surface antigen
MRNQTAAVVTGLAMLTPVPVVAQDWTFYGGGELFVSRLDSERLMLNRDQSSADGTGLGLGGFLGLRTGTGPWLFGAELGLELGSAEADGDLVPGRPAGIEEDYGYVLSLLGGYQVSEPVRLFARLGYTTTRVDFRTAEGSTVYGDGSEDLAGLTVGLGLDYRLSGTLSLRAEYAMTDYDDSIETTVGSTVEPVVFDDISRDAFTIGVAVDF